MLRFAPPVTLPDALRADSETLFVAALSRRSTAMRLTPVCRPLLTMGFVLALISALAPAGQPDAPKTKPVPDSPEKVRNALDQSVTLTDQLKNAATLKDFLDVLEAELKLKFDIDYKAFAAEGATNILATDYTKSERMRVKDIKVKDLLRNLLTQIVVTAHPATYVVIGDTIILTTEYSEPYRVLKQRVSLDCDVEELSMALRRLADKTGATLVLDSRADEAKTSVTVQLNDVTLETAAILLAEKVRLKAVRVGNAVFLTTKEHANEMLQAKVDQATGTPAAAAEMQVSPVIGPLPLPKEFSAAALP
jgi:hypothetical protein